MIKTFESYVNDEYLIGLPSGQIIDIDYKMINNLKQEGYIVYNKKYMSYVFKDEVYLKILKYLKMPLPSEVGSFNLDLVQEFFDNQRTVRSYMITSEGIEVNGNVYISGKDYVCYPFQFKQVTGDFIWKNCKLKTLEMGPKRVGGDFIVSYNDLTDLIGGPEYVGGNYDCSNNSLISLNGSPKMIFKDFDCSGNKVTSFKGGPEQVKGIMDCSGNNIDVERGRPKCNLVIRYSNAKKRNEDNRLKW